MTIKGQDLHDAIQAMVRDGISFDLSSFLVRPTKPVTGFPIPVAALEAYLAQLGDA